MSESTIRILAHDTVHCLCQNNPIADNLVERIHTGQKYATNEDLAQVVYKGCRFFKVDYYIHQWTENEGHVAKSLRRRWTTIFDMGEDHIKAQGRGQLLSWFGGVCTAIEKIMIHIDQNATGQYHEAVLHSCTIQNRPTAYQSAMWPQEGVIAAA